MAMKRKLVHLALAPPGPRKGFPEEACSLIDFFGGPGFIWEGWRQGSPTARLIRDAWKNIDHFCNSNEFHPFSWYMVDVASDGGVSKEWLDSVFERVAAIYAGKEKITKAMVDRDDETWFAPEVGDYKLMALTGKKRLFDDYPVQDTFHGRRFWPLGARPFLPAADFRRKFMGYRKAHPWVQKEVLGQLVWVKK